MKTRTVSKSKLDNLEWRMKNVYYPTLNNDNKKEQYSIHEIQESNRFLKPTVIENKQAPLINAMNQETFKSYLKNFYTPNEMFFKQNTKKPPVVNKTYDERNKNPVDDVDKKKDNADYLNLGVFIRQKVKSIIENYQKLHQFSPQTRHQTINYNKTEFELDKHKNSLNFHDRGELVSSDSTIFHGHDVSMVTLISSELKTEQPELFDKISPKYEKQHSVFPSSKDSGASTQVTSVKILNKNKHINRKDKHKNLKRKKRKLNRSFDTDNDKTIQAKKYYPLKQEITKQREQNRKRGGGNACGDDIIRPVKNAFVKKKYSFGDSGKKPSLLENLSKHGRKLSDGEGKNCAGERRLQSGLDKSVQEVIRPTGKFSKVVLNKNQSINTREKKLQFRLETKTQPIHYGTITPNTIWSGVKKLRGCVVLEDGKSCSGFLLLDSKEKKKLARTLEYNIYFILHRGQTMVTINGTNYLPKILDHLYVPVGAKYSIKNLSHEQALFSYVKIKPL